jgi:hypothetical protein
MSREAAELARSAAHIVQQRGLSKAQLLGADGSVCMHGALNVALCGNANLFANHVTAHKEVLKVLAYRFHDDASSAFPGADSFNDLPETTATDVAKVLLNVADELELA